MKFEGGLLPLFVKVVEQLGEACVVVWVVMCAVVIDVEA